MPNPVVRVEGARELAAQMRTASAQLRLEMRFANEQAAEVVVDEAMPNVPVGPSGNLRRSVRASASVASGRAVAGGSGVPYGNAIHWGRKVGNVGRPRGNHKGPNVVSGRPFLWNAAKTKEPEITTTYGVVVDGMLNRIIG
jgi:hypothetical protein